MGINFFPLCIKKLIPTNSGIIVDLLDQVFITCFLSPLERFKTFSAVSREGAAARQGSSSWQSLQRGTGSVEASYLNGEIVMLGRLFGIPTPVNLALQETVERLAREGMSPGSLTLADIDFS